jgi:hypothetical protein
VSARPVRTPCKRSATSTERSRSSSGSGLTTSGKNDVIRRDGDGRLRNGSGRWSLGQLAIWYARCYLVDRDTPKCRHRLSDRSWRVFVFVGPSAATLIVGTGRRRQ